MEFRELECKVTGPRPCIYSVLSPTAAARASSGMDPDALRFATSPRVRLIY